MIYLCYHHCYYSVCVQNLADRNILVVEYYFLPSVQAVDVIPDRLYNSLGTALFDESLATSYPQCHAVLTHFAQLLDLEAFRHFCQMLHVRQSMLDTCRFVLQARSKVSRLFQESMT